MKLRSFKDKLPLLGSNILVVHEANGMIGICTFDLKVRKAIINEESSDYYPQDWFSDDPSEDRELDIRCVDYWCYPSEFKVSKKKQPLAG